MNIKYHVALGLGMDIVFKTNGLMTLFSILPDHPLIINEIKLIKEKRQFNADEVELNIWRSYMVTHSLFILPLIYYFTPMGSLAYLIHIISDWFTHTGRFSARPFYPFPYVIKWGKDILK